MKPDLPDLEATPHPERSMKVYLLGCVDFDSMLLLQEKALREIHQEQSDTGVLFICEHPPLMTVGREGSHSQFSDSWQDLKASQVEIRWVNRGGGAILHSPGQLAVYPILPLKQLGLGIQDYLRGVEQAIITMAAEQGVEAELQPDATGISSRCGQFAFVGAAIKSWISYYGFYINVSPDMKLLRLIDSNRYDHRLTSLSATLTREASMSSVRESIVRNLVSRFGYRDYPLFTRHPLLNRVKKKVYGHA